MRHRRFTVRFALAFVALAAPGCGAPASVGNVDPVPAAAVAPAPAVSDDPVIAAPVDESLVLPAASALPLGASDVLRLSDADAIEVGSVALPMKDGSVVVVFDRLDAAFTRGSLYSARSSRGRRFTKPAPFARGSDAYVVGPSAVIRAGSAFLYHEEAKTLQGRPSMWRSALGADGHWAAAERLPAIADVTSLLSWPEVTAMGEGALLAFRGGATSACRVATSTDGVTFAMKTPPCTTAAAMAASATFANGSLAFSHQNGDPANMISYVMTSNDRGASWSTPLVVSNAADVHDTSFVKRLDGGLDLYFIYPPDDHGFSLFRRALTPAGVLGPEERVTQSSLGEPSKPHVARLTDGRLLLSYAEIAKRGPSAEPTVQRIVLASLAKDAPAP